MEENNKISYSGVNWLLFFNIVLYVVITELVIIVNSYISYNEPDTYLMRIIVQTLGILLPVIIFSKSNRLNFTEFYRIKPLSLKNCAVIICLGIWRFYEHRRNAAEKRSLFPWPHEKGLKCPFAYGQGFGFGG